MGFEFTYFLWHCYFFEKTGFPCPTCGFTRAAIVLGKGNIIESLQYNAGLVPFVFTLGICIYSLFNTKHYLHKQLPYFAYGTIIILIMHWIIKIFIIFTNK